MIEKLLKSKDPLVSKLSSHELYLFEEDNRYHSPEESESDQDN